MLFSCKYIYLQKENPLNDFANKYTVLFCIAVFITYTFLGRYLYCFWDFEMDYKSTRLPKFNLI